MLPIKKMWDFQSLKKDLSKMGLKHLTGDSNKVIYKSLLKNLSTFCYCKIELNDTKIPINPFWMHLVLRVTGSQLSQKRKKNYIYNTQWTWGTSDKQKRNRNFNIWTDTKNRMYCLHRKRITKARQWFFWLPI